MKGRGSRTSTNAHVIFGPQWFIARANCARSCEIGTESQFPIGLGQYDALQSTPFFLVYSLFDLRSGRALYSLE